MERLAYRHRGHPNLYPADRELNLPPQRHSHGLRRLAAIESARGSFEAAADAIARATGQHVGKRQVEQLAPAAVDVDVFYAASTPQPAAANDVLVISADGKGIIMRPDDAPVTASAAAAAPKLDKRRSKGERRYRKRFAEVGAVYDITPVARSPGECSPHERAGTTAPTARASGSPPAWSMTPPSSWDSLRRG